MTRLANRHRHDSLIGMNDLAAVKDLYCESPINSITVTDEIDFELEFTVTIIILQTGVHKEVANTCIRAREQVYVTLDATQRPKVLVLEIAARAPPIHFDRDRVFACLNKFRDVEFRRRLAALAIACVLTVDPQVEGRTDRAELYENLLVRP